MMRIILLSVKVKYVEDWGDAHTAVLQWSFDENDYKTLSDLKLIKDGKTTADLTTFYVRCFEI